MGTRHETLGACGRVRRNRMKSLATISMGLLLSLFSGLVLAAQQGGSGMMRDSGMPHGGMMMGAGMMVVCIVFGVLILVALVLGILALVKYLRSKP